MVGKGRKDRATHVEGLSFVFDAVWSLADEVVCLVD